MPNCERYKRHLPISVQSTAEIIWQGKEEPLVFLDSLKEAHLFFLEGMTNCMNKLSNSLFLLLISSETDHIMYYEAADAKKQYE
jgi:hypothetical protein